MALFVKTLFLQLILNVHRVAGDLLYKEDVNYKDTFCSDIFLYKNKRPSKIMCARECGMDPACMAFFYDVTGNCYVITQPINGSESCVYQEGKFYKSESFFVTTTTAMTTTTISTAPSTTTTADITSTTLAGAYTQIHDQKSEGTQIGSFDAVQSADSCISQCTPDPNCAGVNYNPDGNKCTYREEVASLTAASGIIYYQKN